MKRLRRLGLLFASAVLIVGWLLPEPVRDALPIPLAPSGAHWLGTSPYGDDLVGVAVRAASFTALATLAATALTAGLSFLVALVVVAPGLGLLRVALLTISRTLDALGLFLLCLAIGAVFSGLSVYRLGLILPLVVWPTLAGNMASELISLRERPEVESAVVLGLRPVVLLWHYVVPHFFERMAPQVMTLALAYVGAFGALEYLGVGVRQEMSLGFILFDASQNYFRSAPWYLFAGVLGYALVLAWVLLLDREIRASVNAERPS